MSKLALDAVTFTCPDAQQFFALAKQQKLTGQVVLNLQQGTVCGAARFTMKNGKADKDLAKQFPEAENLTANSQT